MKFEFNIHEYDTSDHATMVPMGFGAARRYVFGLWLAYVFLFLLACIAVAGSARGDGVLRFAMPAWVMILIYYQNRRNVTVNWRV